MKEFKGFKHPASWIVFVLLTALGVVYIYYNFGKANSLVNVDIQMDRETALEKAAALALEFEIGPEDFKQAAAFRNDSHFQNFVELEGGGLDKFTEIISEGYYQSYYWSVRHFKEQEANEAVFWFKPNGETYGFFEKIPESEKGDALTQERAQQVAEHHAIYNWDVDLDPWILVEKSQEEQSSGRIDHSFVYERTDKSLGEAKFRLTLKVSGNKLTAVDYSVKIPEDFNRRYSEMRSANETIQTISTGIIALIYGILGVILAIFILLRSRRLIWKPALFWGLGITFFSVFLLNLNSLPFAWFSYDTSMSESNFLFRIIFNGFSGAVGFGAIIALSLMAAEGLGRMAFPDHIQWWKIGTKNTAGSLPVLGQTVAGYLFAVIILAIDVLFYVSTTTHFDWWSPAGTLSDPNILANYVPWLSSIAISLQAGFWEEALFRAVPIAGVFILTKNKKTRNLWIVIVLILQTLIFGAAHASYPQQPSYARVLEMIIPFFIMGIIYIYFGILPAVIAHYTVDVFWISLPLWVSSAPGIWTDRFFVLLFLFLPVFIVLFFRIKNKKWLKIPETNKNKGWKIPPLPEKTKEIETEIRIPKLNVEKWLIPLGIAGLAVWIFFTPFKIDAPILSLKKEAAVEIATNELNSKYNIKTEDWKVLSTVSDKVDIRDIFVWQEGGETVYATLLKNYLAPPHWQIRLVKTKGKVEDKAEEFVVQILNSGEILSVAHKIPEKNKGANLSRQQAQIIVDSVLINAHQFNRKELKEISISPTKQENRTDWEFIYADTISFPLEKGQGRYLVEISGDEITKTYSYIHVPEEWIRNYKKIESSDSIIKTTGLVLLIGTLVFGIVLGIVRWTRKKFNVKIFVFVTLVAGFIFALEILFSWPSVLFEYNTQIPMNNFVTTLLIGISISGIFFSLGNGIFVGASLDWFPIDEKHQKQNIIYSLLFGFLVMAILSISQFITPKAEPFWLNFSFLNSNFPWILFAVSRILNILIYPAFAFLLYMGIQHFTNSWTSQKWIGVLLALLAGFSISAVSFQNYETWVFSGLFISIFVLATYFFFIRFHFEWIPISFGFIPMAKMAKEMIIINSTSIITGGLIMLFISLIILGYWQKLLIIYSNKRDINHY